MINTIIKKIVLSVIIFFSNMYFYTRIPKNRRPAPIICNRPRARTLLITRLRPKDLKVVPETKFYAISKTNFLIAANRAIRVESLFLAPTVYYF